MKIFWCKLDLKIFPIFERIYFEQHAELARTPYIHSIAPSISSRMNIGFACSFGDVDEIWGLKVEIFLMKTRFLNFANSFFAKNVFFADFEAL